MAGGVEYQVTKVDPTNPETKGMVYQVNSVSEEVAATLGGKVYRARIIKDPSDPTVAGKVYQIVIIADPSDPSVKGKVYNAILTGGSEAVVIGPAVSPLSLPDAIANSLEYLKAFGGTEQRNLPSGYTQLEYIESTGTQYIDTGITINEDSKVDILYSMTSIGASQMPFGTRMSGSGSDAMNGIFRTHGLDSNRVAFGNGGGTNKDIQGYNASNTDYNLVIDKNAAVINETTVATFSTSSITNTFPMYIFACNTSGTESFGASMKLYSFKLYNNNILVRNFIPAKNSSNVVGMYDTVSQTFFTNAGTGDFVAGADVTVPSPDYPMDIISNNGVLKARHQSGLPWGYTLLEYIESSGTQYINSNIMPTSNTIVKAKTLKAVNNGFVFGSRNAVGSPAQYSFVGAANSSQYRSDYGSSNVAFVDLATQIQPFEIFKNKNVCTLTLANGTTASVTNTDSTFNCAHPLFLFATNTGGNVDYGASGTISTKIYYFQLWQDTTLTLDLIPARRNSDNVLGMYDLVSGQFFTNAGTGDFVAGNVINDVEIYADGTVETITDALGNTATCQNLLSVGDYEDVQEILSGAITRNVGVKVLDGTENWVYGSPFSEMFCASNFFPAFPNIPTRLVLSTHFIGDDVTPAIGSRNGHITRGQTGESVGIGYSALKGNVTAFKQFLADQYAAGTPVIIVYPLATPTTESVTGQALQVQQGDNIVEITQASLDNLELEAKYEKEGA